MQSALFFLMPYCHYSVISEQDRPAAAGLDYEDLKFSEQMCGDRQIKNPLNLLDMDLYF